jgi:hypothetical protein
VSAMAGERDGFLEKAALSQMLGRAKLVNARNFGTGEGRSKDFGALQLITIDK